jgi:spore germination cell wall hydrolase CwlJ-like protein
MNISFKLLLFGLLLGLTSLNATTSALSDYERQIIATCLVLESASEGTEGMRAVLNVIHNRAEHRLERVVRETIKRGQFSAMHSIWGKNYVRLVLLIDTIHRIVGNPDFNALIERAKRDRMYESAVKLVLLMEKGLLEDNTQGSTHYHTLEIKPYWADSFKHTVTLGNHRFYREE